MAHSISIDKQDEADALPSRARMSTDTKELEEAIADTSKDVRYVTRTKSGGSGAAQRIAIPVKE
jgi:hypothetical protein